MNEDAMIFVVCGFIVAVVIGVGAALSAASCHRQWQDSEFQTDWGMVQGCRISKDGKRWIPAENYREL